ncbi:MAG: serine/threonine protein kinase [Fibrobacteres bacterium]|nr:serine/threonine protein kinase [Fibrobacterota bacterium]
MTKFKRTMDQDQDITTMKTRALGKGATKPGQAEVGPAYPDRLFATGSQAILPISPSQQIPVQAEPATGQMPQADPSLFADGVPVDPFSGDPFLGRMVGNCKILEKINEGGSALIYRAHNVNFGLDRVIKILRPALAEDADNFERFKQEAQLTARLDHPNILRVFDTGEIARQFYIEMEYVEGQSLRTYLGNHVRLRETDILGIASQIAGALDYAHNVPIKTSEGETIKGILHRDIKPENIMITTTGTVKLMDFGAAKPMSVNTRTMQGTVVGTPHYMSPEQINGDALDARSDFFSLGVLLYELCTGRRPFEADNLASLLWKIDDCKFERVRKLRSAISPLTEELVEKLLSKDPDHRPATAAEIQETLQISLRAFRSWGSGGTARIPFSWKRAYPTVALCASLVALALSGYTFWRGWRFMHGFSASPELRSYFSTILGKGLEAEMAKDYSGALAAYELVPPPDKGGDHDAYLEARLRSAAIYFRHKDQLTKARSVLEGLRRDYDDPAIDAYLGQLYYGQALYMEAKERLEAYFNSTKTTVLRNSNWFNPHDFQKDALYAYANALDGQYTYIEQKPENLDAAVSAWDRFSRFADCNAEAEDKRCRFAEKRSEELARLRKK